jgi:hypothetical protein
MNVADISPWFTIALASASLIGTLWAIISKPGAKAQEDVQRLSAIVADKAEQIEFAELEERVRVTEGQLAAVRADLQHLPDKDTSHRMEMAIARLEGRLETMDERLKPVAAMASRMQDFMLEEARSK